MVSVAAFSEVAGPFANEEYDILFDFDRYERSTCL
jgi:hypothetical protein